MSGERFHSTLHRKDPLFAELTEHARFLALPNQSGKVPRMYDVSSITENPVLFKKTVLFLANRYRQLQPPPTHILAIESRGFVLGAPLAMELGIPFVLMRTQPPAPASFEDFDQERSLLPTIVVRNKSINASSRVVIVDDIISSGCTMVSAVECVNVVGANIVEIVAVCDMIEGGGVEVLKKMASSGGHLSVFTFFSLRNSLEAISYSKKKRKTWSSNL
ncbi:Phosphoribosyl transferase domain containing protein, putative [Angomonas deanei]|uniref:adenine phosphoribosyltransferase n=1 Tax=Angomonas deanei TaxID=59799 RepID=A0A7G2CA28_9TRYP|nr:Phosphoribosyl transferase domain containing protein, putative [Angomonas deanei]